MISPINQRIQECLNLANSLNFTNDETEQMTLQLYHLLNRLLPHIVTKQEWRHVKQRPRRLGRANLHALYQRITSPPPLFRWLPHVGLGMNARLLMAPSSDATIRQLFKRFMADDGGRSIMSSNRHYVSFHVSASMVANARWLDAVKTMGHEQSIHRIILPWHAVQSLSDPVRDLQDIVDALHLKGIIIDGATKVPHIRAALSIITQLLTQTTACACGVSVNIVERASFFCLHHYLQAQPESAKKRLVIRLKKAVPLPQRSWHDRRYDAYHKWCIYTLASLARQHQCHILVESNHVIDTAWLMILIAQLKVSSYVFIHTDQTNNRAMTKLLLTISGVSTSSSTIILGVTPMDRLITVIQYQMDMGRFFPIYRDDVSHRFIQSHRRFFFYLGRNFIRTYLNWAEKKWPTQRVTGDDK